MAVEVKFIPESSCAKLIFTPKDSIEDIQQTLQGLSKNIRHLSFDTRLTRLNNYSKEFLTNIFLAIPDHITYLDLNSHYLMEKHVDALKALLLKNNLLHIDLQYNPIGNLGALALASATTNKVYYFSDSNFKDSIMSVDGAEALANNPCTAAFACQRYDMQSDFYPKKLHALVDGSFPTFVRILKEKAHAQENPIKKSLLQLISTIEKIQHKDSTKTQDLNHVLDSTLTLLTGNKSLEDYQMYSQKVQGAPSKALKLLGGLMLALSALIAANVLILASPVTVPILTVGTISAVAGLSFFAKGTQTSVSKAMDNFSSALENSPKAS